MVWKPRAFGASCTVVQSRCRCTTVRRGGAPPPGA